MGEHREAPRRTSIPLVPLDVEALRAELRGQRLGNPLIYLPAIGSTNTYATELARKGASDGTLVMTDDQTMGRGRIGRTWKSLPGQQLILSLILRPNFPPHFLVMASALAAAEAIEAVTGARPDIKWPNDILLGGRKLSGILIEATSGYAVLGIGLNVNGSLADDSDLAARATTLAQALGHQVSRETLAVELLHRLDTNYSELLSGGEQARRAIRSAWRARVVTLGRSVTLRQGEHAITGVAEDVNSDGALLLRGDDGMLQTVAWGDVE